jgi:cell division protein FtsZ
MQKVVDTLIIITNQNLFRLANEKTTFTEAFSLADAVLYQGVKGVTALMGRPGLINLDFADVRAVMDEMGKAMMGTGEAEGEDRAIQAAEKAIANPLLDEISLKGAKGVLINITGGGDLTLFELDEAANRIREEVDADANIIVGSTMDETLDGMMRVSVVATGIDAIEGAADTPMPRRTLAQPIPQAAPAPAPAPVAAAPAPAPVQPEPAPEQPSSLFDNVSVTPTPAQPAEPVFQPQPEPMQAAPVAQPSYAPAAPVEDDLPPPAYRPAAEYNPQPETIEADPQDFVAPRAPAPGTPSPETMARLRHAAAHHREEQQPMMASPAPAPAPTPEAEKPRFSMNSLIGRMTGGSGTEQAAPAARRQQPQVQAHRPMPVEEPEVQPEDDRIEIPAFLRRQAN